ncbi:AAA family ATPase [Brucepastera parasyntrophica]|uniref:AAA family ATPase n=1 Tax=Brucepastera parasyntrophica TaxID=2880008 RepID=UPI00210D3826|nr:ATP-binding protein [Brucepastera parasyntrophica]
MKIIEELIPEQIAFSIPEETVRHLRLNGAKEPIIGQDRAIDALELGLGINASGYNIFISGASGTGRRTVLTTLLADYKANWDELQDIAYAYNFSRPLEPKALFFPAGCGADFKKKLHTAIDSIRRQTRQTFKSEAFLAEKKKIAAAIDTEENQILADFERRMIAEGFKLVQIRDDKSRSMDLVPVFKRKPVSFDELQIKAAQGKFSDEKLTQLRETYYRCMDQMAELFSMLREKRRSVDKEIRGLKTKSASPIIENELAFLKSFYSKEPGNRAVLTYLAEIKDDLLSRLHIYAEPFRSAAQKRTFFERYEVNLFSEHTPEKNYIIQEEVPTFANLFGSIEVTDGSRTAAVNGHLRLRAGAVHRAFGGFLVLRLQDLLMEDGAWPYLKRVLQSGKIEIQTPPSGNQTPSLLKPEALPAKLKVIIIGEGTHMIFCTRKIPISRNCLKSARNLTPKCLLRMKIRHS